MVFAIIGGMYTTTINQNGLILLNKAAREALGVKLGDRVTINFSKNGAVVERELSDEDFFKKLDARKSAKTKQRIREMAGKTADEMFEMAIKKAALKEEADLIDATMKEGDGDD